MVVRQPDVVDIDIRRRQQLRRAARRLPIEVNLNQVVLPLTVPEENISGFMERSFTGRMSFTSPNHQCEGTEGITKH